MTRTTLGALAAVPLDGLDQWPSLGCGIKWKPGTEPT